MKLFSRAVRKLKNIAHLFLAVIALFIYKFPSRKIKVIGVTGTDGKTTTSSYIYQLLNFSGKKAALISTVGVFMDGKKESLGFHVTTPSPFSINKYLKRAAEKNIEYVVLEVSSHALDQYRVYGIDFQIGILTNVTEEHLDYHRSMKRYLDAKLRLLKVAKKVVLDVNGVNFNYIVKKIGMRKIHTYSLTDDSAQLCYSSIRNDSLENLTSYNKSNLMAAILALDLLEIDRKTYWRSINKLDLPEGRLQYLQKKPFEVIIDFAHTPNAFDALLFEMKDRRGRLIHVFGSAGERDRFKRPMMGKVSYKFSDIIILTGEDSRSEKVADINRDIKKGMGKIKELSTDGFDNLPKEKVLFEINDRREAIKFSLKIAKSGDTVIISGKGPEESMNMGDGEVLWNDIAVTKQLLKK